MKEQSGYLSRQKNFIFLIFCCLRVATAMAQTAPYAIGARSWGVANATVASADAYAILNNIAGLGGNQEAAVLSTYDSHYQFEGLNTVGFAGVIPFSNDLSAGFSLSRFGDKLYNELSLGIGVGHRIEWVSLGLKVDYLQTAVNAPSLAFSRKAFVFQFGGLATLSEQLLFGAQVYNLTQSRYSGIYGNKVPTILRAGFLYMPLKAVRLSAELEKNTDLPLLIKIGLAYQVWNKLWLRTGVSPNPMTHHLGAGFTGGKFSVDYAVHSSGQLGWSHHLSMGYSFWGRDKK